MTTPSILEQLLEEKVKQDLGQIVIKYNSLRPEMKTALSDFSNVYSFFFCPISGKSFSESVATMVKNFHKGDSGPIAKNYLRLSELTLNSQDQAYMGEIYPIIDAANVYLKQEVLNESVLRLFYKVMSHYCYGRDVALK